MNGKIPEPIVRRIWAILGDHAGAPHAGAPGRPSSAYEQFVVAFTVHGCREFRFGGLLGFGGKLYNERRGWRVACYPEDETPHRLRVIEATNAALKSLWDKTAVLQPEVDR